MTKQQFSSSQFRALRNASESVARVTEQLKEVIWKAADAIAEQGEPGDTVVVAGVKLKIEYTSSRLNGYNMLYIVEFEEQGDLYNRALNFSESFTINSDYLHSDFNCRIFNATRDQKLWFAENLGEILQAFIKLFEQKQKDRSALIAKIQQAVATL